jgi:4-hydroxy-4-methyl-2-oxoglutarate aldolase
MSTPTFATRLSRCFSSVLHDVAKDLKRPVRVLPRTLRGIEPTMRCAGPVFTVRGRPDPTLDKHTSLYEWAGLLSKCPAGSVVICQPLDDTRALFGGLSAEALKLKGVLGYIVDGGCRDAQAIVDQEFPVFTRFYTPIDIVGAWKAEAYAVPIAIGGVDIRPDDYVMADRDGIILIANEDVDAILEAAEHKMSAENAMVDAIRSGMDPQAAYLKHKVF